MQHRADHGTVRLRLLAAAPCVARVTWYADGYTDGYADGRVAGQRRLYIRETDLVLPEGRWLLEVTDERSAHDPGRLAATRVRVQVRAGWRTPVEVPLERGAALSGSVRDAGGRPVRFAVVQATAPDGREVSVRADGRGRYTLAGLPLAPHLVRATRSGRSSAVAFLEPLPGANPGVDLTLDRDCPDATPPAGPEPRVGAAFSGQVLDAGSGAASYAAIVEVRDSRGVLLARTRTDHGGRFVVGGDLPASSGLTVVVKSGPDRIAVAERRLRGLGCHEAQLVDLGAVTLPRRHRAPGPWRTSLPRATAAAMSLPATRV